MSAQRDSDDGQQAVELDWTNAQTAWNEFDKGRAAINHEFGAGRPITVENRTLLELEYSLAIVEHERTRPSMPRPEARRTGANLRPVPAWHTGTRPYWGE